ncbi:MAG: right-handed parallel beta-helix repeat-containing protein [Acetobacteraceae bacterium]
MVVLLIMIAMPAGASRVLTVGPGQRLQVPSQAATIAADGDRIVIEPGTYADCAVWSRSNLVIEARAPGVVITGKPCGERGLFITTGRNITIRGITFAGAESVHGNAAGILSLGANLTVRDSRFLNNQNGILAAGPPDSVLRVEDSTFEGNGSCIGACAHAIYAGAAIAVLDIERSRFFNTRTAHHIKSRARTTVIVGNRIEDGPEGTSSYLIETPNGGNLLVQDNVLHKGALSENASTAISIGVEGMSNATEVMIIRDNRFRSDLPEPTLFVRNSTQIPAILAGNRLTGRVTPLDGPGTVDP